MIAFVSATIERLLIQDLGIHEVSVFSTAYRDNESYACYTAFNVAKASDTDLAHTDLNDSNVSCSFSYCGTRRARKKKIPRDPRCLTCEFKPKNADYFNVTIVFSPRYKAKDEEIKEIVKKACQILDVKIKRVKIKRQFGG